ncbi:MAG: TIGR01777 family oxidoreductase [bacterium]
MNIVVTGSTGLIGSELVPFLTTGGHPVKRLVRSKPKPEEDGIHWDSGVDSLDSAKLEGLDAVVHLAGESIAEGRWTDEKKARIRESRVKGTRLISETLAKLKKPPKVLVCASAIGYYGDRGEEILKETSAAGSGFLSEVCRKWEAATEPATQKGIRVGYIRFGVVLSPKGGALAKMLFPFKMGVGGIIGNGQQYMSWISVDDAVGAIYHAITTDTLKGPINAVAPNPVTNREFTQTLGRVLVRPTIFPMPALAARLVFGEMANELLLASTRVEPAKLLSSGYKFRHPELEGALRHLLGK